MAAVPPVPPPLVQPLVLPLPALPPQRHRPNLIPMFQHWGFLLGPAAERSLHRVADVAAPFGYPAVLVTIFIAWYRTLVAIARGVSSPSRVLLPLSATLLFARPLIIGSRLQYRRLQSALCYLLGIPTYWIPQERYEALDTLIQYRDHHQDPAIVHDPARPPPPYQLQLTPELLRLAGPFSISVAMELKAEGLGSAGRDTADTRQMAHLRACDLMRRHGLRPTHVARSAPMAVTLAFIPLLEEVVAAQMAGLELAQLRQESVRATWRDPRHEPGARNGLGGLRPDD